MSVPTRAREVAREVADELRVLIVGGIPVGVLVVGIGSRLAMLLLRLTSPDRVRGVTSDDGFTIGQVTLSGTYNLLLVGAAAGLIGAAAYRMVAPWLIGPKWFRRLTTGAASAAVVGSMLVHADGIDFTLLEPTWLAIGLFVALPGLFGALIGPAVDRVARSDSWTAKGRRGRVLPIVAVACFPLTLPLVVVVAAVLVVGVRLRHVTLVQRVRTSRGYGLVVRSLWLLIAVVGLLALVGDVDAIA